MAEEVTDCGPIIDLEKTSGCSLLKDQYDIKKDYPDCCPVYDCEESADIVYFSKTKKEQPRSSAAPTSS